jgi:hypothetical protein
MEGQLMLAAQRILKSAIACSSRTMPGFAEGVVGRELLFLVRYTPKSRHSSARLKCPLWAKSGHEVSIKARGAT